MSEHDLFTPPYQFIPVTGRIDGKARPDVAYADVAEGHHDFIRHDLWHRDGLSGRLICRLELETPTFVGNAQDKDPEKRRPTEVGHFELDGRPAVPATSLRGMIGAVAETISQSALRVLDNRDYGVRQEAGQGAKHGNRKLQLGQVAAHSQPGNVKIRQFECAEVPCAVADDLRDRHGTTQFWIDLEKREDKQGGCRVVLKDHSAFSLKQTAHHRTQAWLLILDFPNKAEARAELNRRYERIAFIATDTPAKVLPVSRTAEMHYQTLFAERAISTREALEEGEPPKFAQPLFFQDFQPADPERPWQLQPGQFVYFFDNGSEIVEIRPSQIWRAKAGKTHDYFAAIDPGLLPWGSRQRTGGLSPAEALFGMVQRELPEAEKALGRTGDNLAGRVRFGPARFADDVKRLEPVTLKILSSPKPPSPAMYFHPLNQRGQYLSRRNLAKQGAEAYRPNGRKVYVHHRKADIQGRPWESRSGENSHQKLCIAPLQAGQVAWFHVDFDNLSRDELDLLLTCARPDAAFRHHLGLGKPLGLGTVRVDVAAVCLRDTRERYAVDGLRSDRYREAWREHGDNGWRERYPAEWQRVASLAAGERPQSWRVERNPLIDTETLALLVTAGDPNRVRFPVTQPLTLEQRRGSEASREEDTYEWFVANDQIDKDLPDEQRQAMPALQKGEPLPGMKYRPKAKKGKRS